MVVFIALLWKLTEKQLVTSPVTSNKLRVGMLHLRRILLEYCVRLWIYFWIWKESSYSVCKHMFSPPCVKVLFPLLQKLSLFVASFIFLAERSLPVRSASCESFCTSVSDQHENITSTASLLYCCFSPNPSKFSNQRREKSK